MSDRQLTAPALLAHVFFGRGEDMRAPSDGLVSLWDAITRHLGLDDGIRELPVPPRLARGLHISPDQIGLVAAAESSERSVWQACAWASRSVLTVSVMMAPPRERDCRGQWAALERRWAEALAADSDVGMLGEARLFLALADGPAAELVRGAAPEPSVSGWWRRRDAVPLGQPGDRSPSEALVWEIGPESTDSRRSRRLVCVAPARSERLADRLLWTAGDGAPSPLTRHLAAAAGLRYQVSVHDEGGPVRRLREEIGELVDHLPVVAATGGTPAAAPAGLASSLLGAQASAVSLKRRLTAMRHAVGVLEQNLQHALPWPAGRPDGGPLADDRNLAAWFGQRLDDEVSLIDEATASASAAAALLADAAGRAAPSLPVPAGRSFAPAARPGLASFPRGPRPGPQARRVVVFTALGVEYRAIREYLDEDVARHEEQGTVYEVGTLPGIRGSWQVALAETGPGSTAAGLQLHRALGVFDPEIAIFLGVAGGRKDVTHGDVVAADLIYDYEWGKSTLEGFEPRLRTHHPAHRLLQWARLVARENQWQSRIRPTSPEPRPTCYVKPIVTGGKVVAHDQSETALLLSRYAGDAVAVETEGHGFLEAAYVNPQVDALVIRGISDLLSGKDKHGDEYWQPVACRHAAAFTIEFLNSIGGNET